MRFRDKLGIEFIEAGIHFIPTDHLHTIICMCNDENEEIEEREKIKRIVGKEIRDRETGKLYKVIKGVKEVWVKAKK